MPSIPASKPYRIGRSRTGLGLFATQPIKKGTKIIRYFGPLLDAHNEKHDAIENKYLFQINKRWTIDGSIRKNIARYINHSCKPNAESDVNIRKRKVIIRAIKAIEPGEEINYDYGTEYFKAFLKPIGCKCDACEKKRAKKAAAAKAERAAERVKERAKGGAKDVGAKTKSNSKTKTKTKSKAKAKAATSSRGTKAGGKATHQRPSAAKTAATSKVGKSRAASKVTANGRASGKAESKTSGKPTATAATKRSRKTSKKTSKA